MEIISHLTRCIGQSAGKLLCAGIFAGSQLITGTALAVSPGAALNVQPDGFLLTKDVASFANIIMENNSKEDFGLGGGSLPAVVNGIIIVDLACDDTDCTTPLLGTLSFLSCTNQDAAVVGCTEVGNQVFIEVSNMMFDPDQEKTVARINFNPDTPVPPPGDFFMKGNCQPGNPDGDCRVTAESEVDPTQPPADGEAGGSAPLNFTIECEVELDKYVCVDHDDDADTTNTPLICFGDGVKDGDQATNLEGKPYEWVIEINDVGDGSAGGCVLVDEELGINVGGDREFLMDVVPGVPTVITVDECTVDVDNTAEVICDICEGFPFESRDSDSQSIQCLTCDNEVDKQISCDGGQTWHDITGGDDALGEAIEGCTGWGRFDVDGDGVVDDVDEVQVRYLATNTGEVDLGSCGLVETNGVGVGGEISGPQPPASAGPIFPGESDGFLVTPLVQCTEDLELGEPDSAIHSCTCLASVESEAIPGLLDFGNCGTEAVDSATVNCEEPGLLFSKVCDEQVDESNAITITATNDGDSDLFDCVVTDELRDGTPVPVTPSMFALPAGGEQIVTGEVLGLEGDVDNDATITCKIAGACAEVDDGTGECLVYKTISRQATDPCETNGEGCLTRTPGYWKNHPIETQYFLDAHHYENGDYIHSCGVALDEHFDVAEDMCVSGKEAKASDTNMTNLQLIRQCAAANLNFAASRTDLVGADCEAEIPGISDLIGFCCDNLCPNGVEQGDHYATECIDDLDYFNNLDEYEPEDFDLCPNEVIRPDAPPCNGDTDNCNEAGKNGELNQSDYRDYGPAKSRGGGRR